MARIAFENRFAWNDIKPVITPRLSRSLNDTDFDTNRKLLCAFLFVNFVLVPGYRKVVSNHYLWQGFPSLTQLFGVNPQTSFDTRQTLMPHMAERHPVKVYERPGTTPNWCQVTWAKSSNPRLNYWWFSDICTRYAALKFEWCWQWRQISLIWLHVKIRGGVGEIVEYQLLKLHLRPNLRNIFDGHPLRGCWASWIDKKERKNFIDKA